MNARYWMLRKHFNSMNHDEMKYVPFYSWQCLTLQLAHRDVDLIIQDQQDMDQLLKFLIHKMRTIDGFKSSADKLLELANKEGEEAY